MTEPPAPHLTPPEEATPAEGPTGDRAQGPDRSEVWGALVRAIDAARLYDPDHPLVLDRAEEAARLHAELGGGGPQTFLIEPHALVPLDRPSPAPTTQAVTAEARLARALHDLDAGALRLGLNARGEDFVALATVVAHSRAGGVDIDQLLDVEQTTEGRIRLDALNLAAFTRAAPAAGDPEDPGVNWASLVDCLLEPRDPSSDHAPASTAREPGSPAASEASPSTTGAAQSIARRLLEDPQLGEWLLRTRLMEAGKRLGRSDPESRAAQLEQMQAFAKELERCILAEDESPESDPERVEQHASDFGNGIRQSLMMCRALSGFQPSETQSEKGSWAETVENLLRGEARQEDVPEDYLQRLELLAARQDFAFRNTPPGHHARPAVLEEAAFDRGPVARSLQRIALLLLEDDACTGRDLDESLTSQLVASLPSLAGDALSTAGTLLRIHRLVTFAAERSSATGSAQPSTDHVADLQAAWNEHLDTERVGAEIARALCNPQSIAGAIEKDLLLLLDAAGPGAMEGFAAEAASVPAENSPLKRLGRARLEALQPLWARSHPDSMGLFVQALGPTTFVEAEQLLGAQLRDRNSRRRLAAFAALLEVASELDPDFLPSLLADPDPAVRSLGLQHLMADGPDQAQRLETIARWASDPRRSRGDALRDAVHGLCLDSAGRGLLQHLLRTPQAFAAPRRRHLHLGRLVSSEGDLPEALMEAATKAAAPQTFLDRMRLSFPGASPRDSPRDSPPGRASAPTSASNAARNAA